MALITLRRNLYHLSDFRIHGALAALKNHPVNHVRKMVKGRLCPWFPSLQPEPCRVRFHHACCKKFHSDNGDALHPLGEPVFSQAHEWAGPEQNPKSLDEQMFYGRLNDLDSSEDVLRFIGTLQPLPDSLAAGALQRICEVEKKDGNHRLPKGILENGVFQALCVRFEQESPSLSDTALVTALQALSLLYVDPQSNLLLNLVAESRHRVKRGGLEVRSLCILGESLIRLQGPGGETLELIIYQLQGEKLETFAPEDIVALYRILQACAEKVDRHQAFLNKINSFSLSVVSNLSPTLMSQMLTALVALDQTQALPLVIKLGKYAVRHIPHFTHEELRKVLEAFIYFGHNDRFFTTALEQHVASLCLTLDPEVISTVMEYCGRKRILSKPIFDAVAETFVGQSEKFSPRQVSELIEPFGKLNYLPPNASALFRKLESLLLTRFDYFPPKTLLKILHSCSLVECHPVNFMAKMFSPYFLQQLQGEESSVDRLSLAQLTQLFLTSVLECPFYKRLDCGLDSGLLADVFPLIVGDAPLPIISVAEREIFKLSIVKCVHLLWFLGFLSLEYFTTPKGRKLLPKYQVRLFLTPCCSLETPLDFQLYKSVRIGLIDLLGARMYFASKVLTPYCYTIDVEIKLDEEGLVLPFTIDEDVHKRLALCIDDPKRFSLNSRHLLGKEAIKQRHLRLLGYQVVQIPYYEIEMLKSRVELVEYLQRKLFPHNVGVRW